MISASAGNSGNTTHSGSSHSGTSPYQSATRQSGGVCTGTLWCRRVAATSNRSAAARHRHNPSPPLLRHAVPVYARLAAHCLHCYESEGAWRRGDTPVHTWCVVGASAWSKTPVVLRAKNNEPPLAAATPPPPSSSFRLVTNQGTQVYCWTGTAADRDVWLMALQAGLELSLSHAAPLVLPPPPHGVAVHDDNDTSAASLPRHAKVSFFGRAAAPPLRCRSCGTSEHVVSLLHPMPHCPYSEDRQDACTHCGTAQGVVQYVQWLQNVHAAVAVEQTALREAHAACTRHLQAADARGDVDSNAATDTTTPTTSVTTTTEIGSAAVDSCVDGQDSSSERPLNASNTGGGGGTASAAVGDPECALPSSSGTAAVPLAPTTPTAALTDFVRTAQFAAWARQCGVLAALQTDLLRHAIGATEFFDLLDEAAGGSGAASSETVAASLKKQAFRVAGDMGTAVKLLLEQALPANESCGGGGSDNTAVLQCVLEFFLDLCDDGELSSVAFFWPQLCHIHLRMLPPVNALSVARVDLVEDFLLTVATRYSIHLGLELVWSHTADLEDSLQVSPASEKSGATGAKDATVEPTAIAPSCRRRRFAVLRFICELESLLFDFEGGWGGGTVSLGKMLAPTAQQVELMKQAARHIQELRLSRDDDLSDANGENPRATPPSNRLTRSARFDLLSRGRRDRPPDEQAQEKLRIAKNADYFSCHINFSKRLADVAEQLRFMDVPDRAAFLEEQLNLLNASGTMGGDPLNRVRDHLIRVVRVPSTEGHVFRSKERTPVLLLMEIIDEMAEAQSSAYDKFDDSVEAEPPRVDVKRNGSVSRDASAVEGAEPTSDHGANLDGETVAVEKLPLGDGATGAQVGPIPPPPLLEGALEGCRLSPGPKGLKRFDSDGEAMETIVPTTPKSDVQQIVSIVAHEQLKEIELPDLDLAPAIISEVLSNDDSADTEITSEALLRRSSSAGSPTSRAAARRPSSRFEFDETGRAARKMSTLGSLKGARNDAADSTNTLAPTGDIRRAVLTTIMMRGLQGNTIAAGAADSVQRSLKELERRRATELLLSDDDDSAPADSARECSEAEIESTRQKLIAMGLGPSLEEVELASRPTEEDEVMEAIRLMLIQNQVAQGRLSPEDAARVLQHTSLSPINATKTSAASFDGTTAARFDASDHPTIDAGDVDPRLVGCGPLPPAVLQAMTLWKGGMVTHAELLELVKKDIEFVKHSILVQADNLDMLKENSAFWGRFAFGERWAEKKSRIISSSPQGSVTGWDMMGVIVKSNDDLRQEAFVMQLIELCQEAFELAELELWISPYRILATGRTTGVIECVRNAMSFDALKKRPGYGRGGLREHLQRMTEFTADPGGSFKSAQQNFVRSLAAYSLLSYLFLFKDRHNGNLLLDTAGHVIHIDFGFVFGIAPGGSFSLEMSTPFKLTEEMLDVMGGLRSPLFSEFVTLFCCGFLALQAHSDTFLTLVEITSRESTFKCFEGRETAEIVSKLRERFNPELSKEDTVSFALDLIKQATTSYGTRQYDIYQYLSQGIVS